MARFVVIIISVKMKAKSLINVKIISYLSDLLHCFMSQLMLGIAIKVEQSGLAFDIRNSFFVKISSLIKVFWMITLNVRYLQISDVTYNAAATVISSAVTLLFVLMYWSVLTPTKTWMSSPYVFLHGLTGSVVDHRSPLPEFISWHGHV